jgi:hypothetical protein
MRLNHFYLVVILFSLLSLNACRENEKKGKPGSEAINNVDTLTQEEIRLYTETGKSIAKATFMGLSSNLKDALKRGGVKEAAEYCNIVAIPLTDSLAEVHNATIKRTSLKLRNQKNLPDESELEVLKNYAERFENDMQLKPAVHAGQDNKIHFYAPIMTQQLCLTCHGTVGEELTESNYNIIRELYPYDKAIGYAEDEFRGIWSISFERAKK